MNFKFYENKKIIIEGQETDWLQNDGISQRILG